MSNDKQPEYLDLEEIRLANIAIEKFPFKNSFEKTRNILIFRLLCFTGMESSELLNLTTESFFIENKVLKLKIAETATRRERVLLLPQSIFKNHLGKYIKERANHPINFFYTTNNAEKPMALFALQKIVKDLLVFANVKVADKTARMLRKSFAINLNNEKNPVTKLTMPESAIQEILGVQNRTNLRKMLKLDTVSSDTLMNHFDNLNI